MSESYWMKSNIGNINGQTSQSTLDNLQGKANGLGDAGKAGPTAD